MKDNFKTTIEYNSKQYMLSMIYISGMKIFEIMLFPMKDATIDSNAVFCYRTMYQESASHRIKDICDYPEKYLSDGAIEAYLACQKCGEWCCTLCKYLDIRTAQRS